MTGNEATRQRLPDTRRSITHRVIIEGEGGDHQLYMTVGLYDDGRPGELFVRLGKAGSTLNGLLDVIGIELSFGLQHGVPLALYCRKLRDIAFPPAGPTSNPDIPSCVSVVDYIARWLEREYLAGEGEPAA